MARYPLFVHAQKKTWSIIYRCLQTVNLYRIAPKHVPLELVPLMAGKSEDFDKALKFVLVFERESSR